MTLREEGNSAVLISRAYFSPDRRHRYWLLRVWDKSLPIMGNWGANPSTAAEYENDPTIRKDMGFARRTGHGGLLKMNVGAYRATHPRDWYNAADPWGRENTLDNFEKWIKEFGATTLLAAWGKCIGKFAHRGEAIRGRFPNLMCLGVTADGTPRHTLMLPYSTKLQPFVRHSDEGEIR